MNGVAEVAERNRGFRKESSNLTCQVFCDRERNNKPLQCCERNTLIRRSILFEILISSPIVNVWFAIVLGYSSIFAMLG